MPRELGDVGKNIVDPFIRVGELQLAYTGRVEQPSAGVQPVQRA